MKILISAAETSSDTHGAELLRALRGLLPGEAVEAFGVGGPKLGAERFDAIVDARELLVMGTTEILGRLPRIARALGRIAKVAEERRPEVAVVIDYPDFHFRLAKRLKKSGVPVVYFIPPKVWVWRKNRLATLRERFAKALLIFPFEKKVYDEAGVPAEYVGNPLVDELPLGLTRAEARRRLGLGAEERVFLLMPGSRPAELKRHLAVMVRAARNAARRTGLRLMALMPLPSTQDEGAIRAALEAEGLGGLERAAGPGEIQLRISRGDSALAMRAADAGLVKSGTSTLEAALLGCPHAVLYKPSELTGWVFRNFVRYSGPVGLVNLVGGWEPGKPYLAREILMGEVTEEVLSREATALLTDEAYRARLERDFEGLRRAVVGDAAESPSVRAARAVLEVARGHTGGRA